MARPADPVKPVSQASRSSDGGTYSFWKRSVRGTMKPSSPRTLSSARYAATRGAVAPGSARSSNDWKSASNMRVNLGGRPGGGNPAPSPRAPREHQRGPAVDVDAPFERQRPISCDHRIGLRRQYPGQDDAGTGRRQMAQRRSDARQRAEQDIGEDQIERRAGADRARTDAVGCNDRDEATGAIAPDIVARGAHGSGIDVGREHAHAQGARRGDGEHAAAGADIENARRAPPRAQCLADRVECQQATARGAVMPGAESERRLDLDADAVARHAGAVMSAMNDEAPGGDRRQSGKPLANPVRRFDAAEAQSRGRRWSGRRLYRSPHGGAGAPRRAMD